MNDNIMTAQDYPLATHCPEKIRTPGGKPLTDITLEKALASPHMPPGNRFFLQILGRRLTHN